MDEKDRVGLTRNIRYNFHDGYDAAPTQFEQFTTVVRSNSRSENYGWVSSSPQLEREEGDLTFDQLRETSKEVVNVPYQKGLEIKSDDIRDNQGSIYLTRAREMGELANLFRQQLVIDALEDGNSEKGIDGKNFFSTSHDSGSNLQTTALGAPALQGAINLLAAQKDDHGRKIYNTAMDLLLIVPTALRATAATLINAQLTSSGGSNINYRAATILVLNDLSSDSIYYVMNRRGAVRPMILQERDPIRFIREGNGNAGNAAGDFMSNSSRWKARWRGAATYGMHQRIVRGGS